MPGTCSRRPSTDRRYNSQTNVAPEMNTAPAGELLEVREFAVRLATVKALVVASGSPTRAAAAGALSVPGFRTRSAGARAGLAGAGGSLLIAGP